MNGHIGPHGERLEKDKKSTRVVLLHSTAENFLLIFNLMVFINEMLAKHSFLWLEANGSLLQEKCTSLILRCMENEWHMYNTCVTHVLCM